MISDLTPLIPLSLKGKGEIEEEGLPLLDTPYRDLKGIQAVRQCVCAVA